MAHLSSGASIFPMLRLILVLCHLLTVLWPPRYRNQGFKAIRGMDKEDISVTNLSLTQVLSVLYHCLVSRLMSLFNFKTHICT